MQDSWTFGRRFIAATLDLPGHCMARIRQQLPPHPTRELTSSSHAETRLPTAARFSSGILRPTSLPAGCGPRITRESWDRSRYYHDFLIHATSAEGERDDSTRKIFRGSTGSWCSCSEWLR